eukprot:TRINITY_DN54747_c0_g1_i1.p3 TRINITY_DN54747_c0_g1~~TRINITY_DN54747_c0_g1_i1.p3  ORF type:complete len:143 (-),score=3.23 TRINITY_DN54747_c0_g1_i1:383-811(-)
MVSLDCRNAHPLCFNGIGRNAASAISSPATATDSTLFLASPASGTMIPLLRQRLCESLKIGPITGAKNRRGTDYYPVHGRNPHQVFSRLLQPTMRRRRRPNCALERNLAREGLIDRDGTHEHEALKSRALRAPPRASPCPAH